MRATQVVPEVVRSYTPYLVPASAVPFARTATAIAFGDDGSAVEAAHGSKPAFRQIPVVPAANRVWDGPYAARSRTSAPESPCVKLAPRSYDS